MMRLNVHKYPPTGPVVGAGFQGNIPEGKEFETAMLIELAAAIQRTREARAKCPFA